MTHKQALPHCINQYNFAISSNLGQNVCLQIHKVSHRKQVTWFFPKSHRSPPLTFHAIILTAKNVMTLLKTFHAMFIEAESTSLWRAPSKARPFHV
ncbi:hypothetical protein TNIN_411321 [Trichonephila inaurata madagascariensis]|uniref:Uncharacterized protein n=1 Tax=Trichonephila inaurata madagascariensis TaxID=2747483 RepID=A0A8X6XLV3_9ARAC|nr:hypothetical protein TNIN_411321 [Trichonephila inaurata madagascariensis]